MRRTRLLTNKITDMFQSTHPHGVRPLQVPLWYVRGDVSIHAPTRGATYKKIKEKYTLKVSIHAPTRGATEGIKAQNDLVNVSIHAPTRGATYRRKRRKTYRTFQSTHPHGVRRKKSCKNVGYPLFQSTHPHGVRPLTRAFRRNGTGFNPRTHTGCDLTKFAIMVRIKSFNPRTHTGCDMLLILFRNLERLFQSTHPHGVRLTSCCSSKAKISCFNPRTHTGCDEV